MIEIRVDVSGEPDFNPTQHCTSPHCYTFSHTAEWCGRGQPRYCECPYDYAEGFARTRNDEVQADAIRKIIEGGLT